MQKFFFIITFLISSFIFGQDAKEIIRQHFQKSGGITEWNALNSIKIKGEVAIGVSEVVPLVIEHKRPYFKRVSYVIDGKEMLNEGYDGENAYTYNGANQGFISVPNYQPDAFENDLLNYDKKGFKVEFIKKEKIGNQNAYKIKLIKNTVEDYFWFDVRNYHLIQEKNAFETIRYSDFKTFGTLVFATKMEIQPHGGSDYVLIFNQIQPNANISETRFKFK